jgi:hypothetical protein
MLVSVRFDNLVTYAHGREDAMATNSVWLPPKSIRIRHRQGLKGKKTQHPFNHLPF